MSKEYVCPSCDHMFVIGTMKNALAKKDSEGRRLITCPRCGKTNPMKD